MAVDPLPADALRWRCDPDSLGFETTAELDPENKLVRQNAAVDALNFGLSTDAPGQNIFVRGLSGTGRMTIVERLLAELNPPCKARNDRCYVHNFKQPERPRLVTLPGDMARPFRRRIQELAEFIRDGLGESLNSESIKARREALEKREKEETEKITKPFEDDLKEADLALVSVQIGPMNQTTIFARVDGKPVPPEEFEQLVEKGEVSKEKAKEQDDA